MRLNPVFQWTYLGFWWRFTIRFHFSESTDLKQEVKRVFLRNYLFRYLDLHLFLAQIHHSTPFLQTDTMQNKKFSQFVKAGERKIWTPTITKSWSCVFPCEGVSRLKDVSSSVSPRNSRQSSRTKIHENSWCYSTDPFKTWALDLRAWKFNGPRTPSRY